MQRRRRESPYLRRGPGLSSGDVGWIAYPGLSAQHMVGTIDAMNSCLLHAVPVADFGSIRANSLRRRHPESAVGLSRCAAVRLTRPR